MKRLLAIVLSISALTLGCDAGSDHADHAEHAEHAAHEHRDIPGGDVTGLSLYQLEGDWTSASGERLPLSSLRGTPLLLLMFYGTCDYACPLLVHDMQRVERLLAPDAREQVRYALVTFDPERDSPDRLATYAREQGLAPPRWLLLHGSADQIRELAATLGVRYRPTGTGQFSHTMRIVLLDREGVAVEHWDGLERPLEPIAAAASALAERR